MDDSEPEAKRLKSDEMIDTVAIDTEVVKLKKSTKNLEPIIDDVFFETIPLVEVYVGTIKNPKDISKTILLLNGRMPLNELQHLKRVTKKEVLLCPKSSIKLNECIEKCLKHTVPELENVFETFQEKNVPSKPPKIRRQFDECNKVWPCNFHPNKYHEKLISGNFFDENSLATHKQFMEIALEVANFYTLDLFSTNVAIVVDPTINSIVAISKDNRKEHPMQHSAMLAIDNVAKTQNGGAWACSIDNIDVTLKGVKEELQCHLKKKFTDIRIGAKMFKSKRKMADDEVCENQDSGPYLCTGYDIYLLIEPCVMCSMALVHARVKRVFFLYENSEDGAMKSRVKLQTISSLNHHFEVFSKFV